MSNGDREEYDLNRLKEIGGSTYNHDGQVVRTPNHGANGGWIYLGDDYDEYSPIDVLIKNIVEYPRNYDIYGEVFAVARVSTSYGNDYIEVTSNDEGEERVDMVEFEWLPVEVIVHHNTKMEVRRKSA